DRRDSLHLNGKLAMIADVTQPAGATGAPLAQLAANFPMKELPDFAINGRFLSQPVTGVQRYAREITERLDRILAGGGREATLLLPAGEAPIPPYKALKPVRSRLRGHAWEQ